MKCRKCGSENHYVREKAGFAVKEGKIVAVHPVFTCKNCGELQPVNLEMVSPEQMMTWRKEVETYATNNGISVS